MKLWKLVAVLCLPALAACGQQESVAVKAGVSDCGTPAAPSGLRANPGPGMAQTSMAWSAAAANGGAAVERYIVHRDGKPFARLGNTLAYGDSGASGSHSYYVTAINTCGAEGPVSETISASPLPGALIPAPLSVSKAAGVKLNTYKVLDPSGKEIGQRTWRTVMGLGNCCETYVASDAAGRLYEYGGSLLYVSTDEGQNWKVVSNVFPAVGAEGAIVGAPGGDMLAVNWDPYSGDQLWSHKYVAATDTWYTSRTPLHQPAFDRPWVAVIEGPFEIEGMIVPYVSFLMSNYVHGDVLLLSLDGLFYQAPTARVLAQMKTPVSLNFPRDPDRDWTQSMRKTSVYPLDNGYGLRDRSSVSNCAHAVLTPAIEWACPDWGAITQAPERGEVVRVDSAGAIHVTTVQAGGDRIMHRVSTDAGKTWKKVTARVPGQIQIEDWDVQVNAALDQVVVAVHASAKADDTEPDQDMVFRFTGLQGDIRLKEILLVGTGDHIFGSSLAANGDRFDYTTVALLRSGHVALSFGDRRHVPPAIAIETGN